MTDDVDHMRPSQLTEPGILDGPSTSPRVFDAYSDDLDAEGDWDVSNMLLSSESGLSSRFQVYFSVIREKCVDS